MISIVRTDGIFFIGDLLYECYDDDGIRHWYMENPRVIVIAPDGKVYFQPMLGNPKRMDFASHPQISYDDIDEDLRKAYITQTTGIILADATSLPDNVKNFRRPS